jgi:dCMP deaminase
MDRISNDEYFFNIVETVKNRSTCLKRKVGAILIKDNHIISSGYNGPSKNIPHCIECIRKNIPSAIGHDIIECPACHAEINAIIFAAINGTSIKGSELYISTAPCFDCAKYIINAGIKKIIIPTLAIREPVKKLLNCGNVEIQIIENNKICEIPLSQDKISIIDYDLYTLINSYKWCAYESGYTNYAITRNKNNNKTKNVVMHRFILDYLGFNINNMDVDHINCNGLDNRISNLRIVSRSLNNANHSKLASHNKSGYTGVSWNKQQNKWHSIIQVNKKQIHLGFFEDKIEAALAYNEGAIKYFGKSAYINKI